MLWSMTTTFLNWSVDDVKRWINTWDESSMIISNIHRVIDLNNINGESVVYFNCDDLKQLGLNKAEIEIVLKHINELVFGSYLDYMMKQQYIFKQETEMNESNANEHRIINNFKKRRSSKRESTLSKHEWDEIELMLHGLENERG